MDSTRNLVDALIDGNSIGIQNSFNAAIAEKIADALDDYRVQVAQSMFKTDKQIDEVLDKSATAGEWISDFVHSEDPRFKGASKKERMKRALAAYYKKQRE